FPRSGIKSEARGVRQVRRGAAGLSIRPGHGSIFHVAANDFTRGVKQQRVPEVSRNGFVARAKFAGDRCGNGAGESVRSFVEQHFKTVYAAIARIVAGNCDVYGVERSVGPEGAS